MSEWERESCDSPSSLLPRRLLYAANHVHIYICVYIYICCDRPCSPRMLEAAESKAKKACRTRLSLRRAPCYLLEASYSTPQLRACCAYAASSCNRAATEAATEVATELYAASSMLRCAASSCNRAATVALCRVELR